MSKRRIPNSIGHGDVRYEVITLRLADDEAATSAFRTITAKINGTNDAPTLTAQSEDVSETAADDAQSAFDNDVGNWNFEDVDVGDTVASLAFAANSGNTGTVTISPPATDITQTVGIRQHAIDP